MDWKELEKVAEENKREVTSVETLELGGVIFPLIKLLKYDLYLCGIGVHFDAILSYLKSNDMFVKGIIDPDREESFYDGIPVMLPDELNKQDVQRMFVIITDPEYFYDDRYMASSNRAIKLAKWIWHATKIHPAIRKYNPIICRYRQSNLKKTLEKQGIQNYYFMKFRDFVEIGKIISPRLYNRMSYYRSHWNELKKTYDILYDRVSRETMTEFMRTILQRGFYKEEECDGRNKYFAGYGRGKNMEVLYEHKEDEVWVNCGANVGDTVMLYLADGYKAKRIYAYEGSQLIYKTLCRNIERLPEELKKMVVPINKFIAEGTGWESDIEEKITLINADIQGYELQLLHSMKDKIRSDRPVIAICAYHRDDDLIELPKFIEETVDSYVYVLRKYPSVPSDVAIHLNTNELVLYAIPQERVAHKFAVSIQETEAQQLAD